MLNKKFYAILFWIIFSSFLNSTFCQTLNSNSFTLTEKASTSAGVYKADGTLVRTLWSGVTMAAGTYPIKWDGTDDFLKPLPVDNYVVKVLSNNVQYSWQGTIGNSSTDLVGPNIHRSLEPATNIVIVGANAYFTLGYNEGNPAVAQYALNNPQQKLDPFSGITNQVSDYVASDGTNIYWTGWDTYQDANSWIYATKVSDNSLVSFSNGAPYKTRYGKDFPSVLDLKTTQSKPSGIAVSSTYLFVSYKGLGTIDVLNKTTGALVKTLTLNSPGSIAVDGSSIWITTGTNTLQKYPVNSDGTLGVPSLSIPGLSSPADVRVNGTMLAVVDGGVSNQIKTFNTSTGGLIWTLGQPGGISSSPIVTNDRFAFWKIREETGLKESYGGVAFASDGSFWVCDPSNRRLQHFDSNRNFIESIIFQGKTYTCFVDPNNHARVLGNLMEFQVDYSTSDIRNAWIAKYNWEGNFLPAYNLQDGIKDITTLSNGRTYGLVRKRSNNDYEIVELNPATGLRSTGVIISNAVALKLHPDGTLFHFRGYGLNETAYWEKKTLNGFDASNNPIYPAAFSVILSNSATDIQQPRLSGAHVLPWEVTSSNVLVNFRGNREQTIEKDSYHLGGMNPTTGKWIWKTAISTQAGYQGEFPADGAFDIGNGPPQYAGSVALAMERNIIWGFNGEGWKLSETNKWNHYYDNGLFIGQFGFTGPEYNADPYANAAFAGNAFSPSIVKEGNDYYMYHNDESVHGGLLRWKISGLNTIQEQTVPITTSFVRSAEVSLPGVDLMYGLPYDTVLTNITPTWVRATATESSTWSAKTNVKTYNKRNSPDLYVSYSTPTAGVNTISRDLGINLNLAAWQLTGRITYDGCMPNFPDLNGVNQFFDVLDNNGKIITRFYQTINFNTSPATTTLYANNLVIATGTAIKATTMKLQNLIINKSGTSITLTYAGYAPVTLNSPYDAAANMSNPTTMRLYFTSNGLGNVYPKTTGISDFRFIGANVVATPDVPALVADDVANTLNASSVLGTSEILVSENGGAFVAYTGQINVGNVARAAGYWKFKIKAATARNESAIVNSPEFTAITTPDAPVLAADDVANTLNASSVLGTSEIVVSENGGVYGVYAGQINVGNVARAAGYWKFKIKAATARNESAIVNSPEFTTITTPITTPDVPTLAADDVANTLNASSILGTSEIVVSENGGAFVAYAGQINVGNVARAAGYWQFKIKAATNRNESAVVSSAPFTDNSAQSIQSITLVNANTATDISTIASGATINLSVLATRNLNIRANTSPTTAGSVVFNLSGAEIKTQSETTAPYALFGDVNGVYNAWTPTVGGYTLLVTPYSGPGGTGTAGAPSTFTFTVVDNAVLPVNTTSDAPTLVADDVANTLSASSVLGTSEIVVSENGGAYGAYAGSINVGNVARAAGYWKFKVKSATGRNESAVVNSPVFTEVTTPVAPKLVADDVADTLSASHALGSSEIVVSENGGAYVAYAGQINVGNVARAAGYWKFKIKAATNRNESAVVNSPAFTEVTTPVAPKLVADDVADTLSASHALGSSEIVVSENGGAYVAYAGQINVGNVARAAGYWKFKIKAATNRNESAVVNSPAFTETSQCSATGTISLEVWNNVFGSGITSNNWSNKPNNTSPLTIFEAPRNVADNYAARIRGYLCAPQSGNYTFFIAGDDATELWLSTDANPTNKSKIAYNATYTAPRDWYRFSTQKSFQVYLKAGNKYYIEALLKEVTGDDHLAVAWQLPNGTMEAPIPGKYLSPFVATLNTAPITACSATGTISHEVWNNVTGLNIANNDWTKNPDNTRTLTLFEAPRNIGDNYAARIRGYLCAPQSGNYTFFIAGDDATELWLSTDANPANKTKIAYNASYTAPRDWNRFSTQKSFQIYLQAGNKYYVEALHKEAAGDDHLAVAWQLPDGTMEAPIAGSHLSPYNPGISTTTNAGTVAESAVQVVESFEFKVYPNPIMGNKISIQSSFIPNGDYSLVLINSIGQPIFRASINHEGGAFKYSIPLSSSLAKGIYMLQLSGKDVRFSKQLLK